MIQGIETVAATTTFSFFWIIDCLGLLFWKLDMFKLIAKLSAHPFRMGTATQLE